MDNRKDAVDIHSKEPNWVEQACREDQEVSLKHAKFEICITHMEISEWIQAFGVHS